MPENKKITLRAWMWRAFAQSALIPLVLVETALIAIYLLTNSSIRDAQIEHLRQNALNQLSSTAQQEAQLASGRLKTISQLARLYGEQVQSVLLRDDYLVDELERRRHVRTTDGVLYTRSDDGRAASFYAASTPVERQDRDKALRLSRVDPLMRSIKPLPPRGTITSTYSGMVINAPTAARSVVSNKRTQASGKPVSLKAW